MQELVIKTYKGRLSKTYIEYHLGCLEEQVIPNRIEEVEKLQLDVFRFKQVRRLPILVTMRDDVTHNSRGHGTWPAFTFDHIWNDYGAMLLNELQPVYESVQIKDDKVFTVRPNLSQIVVPSLFGAEGSFHLVNEDSMPSIHKPPSKEKLLETIGANIDFKNHWTIRKYREIIDSWDELIRPFSELKRCLHYSLPDLQGPFNLYFLARGAEAYTDLYENPDFVHRMMRRITQILVELTKDLADYIDYNGVSYYWNYAYPGRIRNVDDNSILISREQYEEFVHPYNIMLSRECGGGIHHYCGAGDHVIDFIMGIEKICGLNFGNPEQQDWEFVYNKALDNQVVLLWDREIPAEYFQQLTKGIIMKIVVSDIDTAKKTLDKYRGFNTP